MWGGGEWGCLAFERGLNRYPNSVLRWYLERSGGLSEVSKKQKSLKVGNVRPLFAD